MNNKIYIHITKCPYGGWYIRPAGQQPIAVMQTQGDATQFGKALARINRGEVLIHGCNGKIRERHSYGHDPFPPRG